MTHRLLSRLAVAAVTIAVALSSIAHVDAAFGAAGSRMAAPRIIVFHGAPIRTQVAMTDHAENLQFLLSLNPVTSSREKLPLTRRQSIEVWMYWNPKWGSVAADTARLRRLGRAEADQVGRIYLSRGDEDVVLVLQPARGAGEPSIQTLSPRAMSILRKHGVPVRSKN